MENHVLSKLHVAQMKQYLENLEWFRNITCTCTCTCTFKFTNTIICLYGLVLSCCMKKMSSRS